MRFQDIPGRERLKAQLQSMVKAKRLPHAQLFWGPEGSGALALALAQSTYLHCTQPTTTDACGTCASCIQMKKCVHPQVRFLFPTTGKQNQHAFLPTWRQFLSTTPFGTQTTWEQQLGATQLLGMPTAHLQEVMESLFLRPAEGHYNMLLIWRPEHLHTSAQQKLLKLLEEPPPQTLFVLVTPQREQLSPVLRSRLQLVRVPPCELPALKGYLTEKYALAATRAHPIAVLAEGNVHHAVELARGNLTSTDTFLGFSTWMRACYAEDYQTLAKQGQKLAKAGKVVQVQFWQYALHLLRASLAYKLNAQEVTPLTEEETGFMQKFHKALSLSMIRQCIAWVHQALQSTLAHGNMGLTHLHTSLQMQEAFKKG